ncbi:hypothetical protein [Haloimpatiens massiliensis]|uniref:hypothetical protein n=1 Tax=Haloimpatiens massiliensis TaxID=1658110 RepID=UPI000C866219|nr:hypothetical protein [Haloimpatiens massiliensis]
MFKKVISALLLLIMVLSFVGCSTSEKKKASETKGTNSKGKYEYVVKVSYNNEKVKEYKIGDIKKLPAESVEMEGKEESGSLVSTILKDCKVGEFSKITFKGIDGTNATLKKEDIENEIPYTSHNSSLCIELRC